MKKTSKKMTGRLTPTQALEHLRSSKLIRPDATLEDVLSSVAKLPGGGETSWTAVYDSDKYCFIIK